MISEVVQIWIDRPLPIAQRTMMRRIHDMAAADYKLITNRPEIVAHFPKASVIAADSYYQTALDRSEARSWWRAYSDRYPQFRSDFIRLAYAIDHPRMVYVDSDLELFSLPEHSGPHIAQDIGRICIVSPGGDAGWVKAFMHKCLRRQPTRIFLPFVAGDEVRAGRAGLIQAHHFHHWKLGHYRGAADDRKRGGAVAWG